MRTVKTRHPSFPGVEMDSAMDVRPDVIWQVLCGDRGHWRAGIYSPSERSAEECIELEKHNCPELFVLLEGKLTLLIAKDRQLIELPLEPGKPVLVQSPHSGFCPDGPHTGRALVVERDEFDTEYSEPKNWTPNQTITMPIA